MMEKMKDLICEYVDADRNAITEDSRFIEDLGFNSYDFMCLVGQAEDEFDIEVQERDIVKIKTVGEAIQYISSLQQ